MDNYQLYRKYKSKYQSITQVGAVLHHQLIVLVGAGQFWHRVGQFRPTDQPVGSVIHVVDPLIITGDADTTTPDTIRHHLDGLSALNHFYQLPFQDYLPTLYDISDQFDSIVVVSYTETVNPLTLLEGVPLPENAFLVYYGHGSQGLPLQYFTDLPDDIIPVLSGLNDVRGTTITLRHLQNNCEDPTDFIQPEHIEQYNQTVRHLSRVILDLPEQQHPLVRELVGSLVQGEGLLWSVKSWITGRFYRPDQPEINRLVLTDTLSITNKDFPLLALV
jgi:hypothetical protein